MQAQINPSLQALLQTAQMVTPDQGPTVAAQVAQAAQQKIQAQAMPPSGIERVLPGAGVQAARSIQAAQPATQGDVNQLRQMMAQAQPPQTQGVAGLPGADVQMAEGGVVGYDGRTGSDVKVDETKLSVDERFKRMLENFIKGTYYGSKRDLAQQAAPSAAPPTPLAPRAMSEAEIMRMQEANASPSVSLVQSPEAIELLQRQGVTGQGTGSPRPAFSPPAPSSTPRPSAGERRQPAAPTGIASTPLLPDTRESTLVNPSQSALQYANEAGRLRELQERLGRKPEETAQEKAYRDAAMAQYQRGIGSIDAARDRFSTAQEAQKKKDLINYLSGIGGAGSLFRGMARSGQALSQVQDQREAAKIAYFDKLDERRNAVENLKLASLKQDAEQARAWSNEVRKIDADITKLMVGLGEKQAGESARAELSREETAAREREAERLRAHQMEVEKYRRQTAAMKPSEQLTIERLEKYKLSELTGGKPQTATPAQQAQALREAIQEARGGTRATDFSLQYDIALKARLARGEADTAETREAARQDVIKGTPAAQRADTAKVKEAQAMVERLMLSPEYRKIKDKAEARRLAKAEAAREYKLTPTDIPDSGAAQPTTTAPRGTRENPIKLD